MKNTETAVKIAKLAKKIKGEMVSNAYGACRIQHNIESKQIVKKGYALINCNSAYKSQSRVDYIDNGEFRSTGVISNTRANRIIDILFGNFDKKLRKAGFIVSEVLGNLETNGYTGLYICVQVAKGNTPDPEKVENMKVAMHRHIDTDYDSVPKKGLSSYEVRELRRSANAMVA